MAAGGFKTVVATASQLQLRPYKVTVTEQSGKTPTRTRTRLATRSISVINPSIKDIGSLKKELEVAQQSYDPPVYGESN
jgi:hypothetical protein